MPITVRPMRSDEARLFLEIHRASVLGVAAKDYPLKVLDAWAAPATPEFLDEFLANLDGELRLIAEIDGRPAGIGALVPHNSELRACYVAPFALRCGVGTALVREIERLARQAGLTDLQLLASLTAEPFYAALGYHVETRTEHVLRSGQPMAAVKMRKALKQGRNEGESHGRSGGERTHI